MLARHSGVSLALLLCNLPASVPHASSHEFTLFRVGVEDLHEFSPLFR